MSEEEYCEKLAEVGRDFVTDNDHTSQNRDSFYLQATH